MKAYHIQQPENGTDYYTTDLMDILNEIEKSKDKTIIEPLENITVAEYHELIKSNINGPENADKE